jgi:predicted secreted protein
MTWPSALAIYFIMWFLCLFLVLPFYARDATGGDSAHVPGQADSAPARFPVWQVVLRVSIVAAIIFGLYYANYVNGWLTPQDINPFGAPPPRG